MKISLYMAAQTIQQLLKRAKLCLSVSDHIPHTLETHVQPFLEVQTKTQVFLRQKSNVFIIFFNF